MAAPNLLILAQNGRLEFEAVIFAASLRHAFFGMPMMTLGVILRIHWQALRLWLKRVPFIRKPAAPERFVTR